MRAKSSRMRRFNPRKDMEMDLEAEDDSNDNTNAFLLTSATFLRYHVYRLYVMGQNSAFLPFIVPAEDIPTGALAEGDQSTLE